MSQPEDDDYKPVLIQLEGELTIESVATWHEKIVQEIDENTNVQIEATKVSSVDAAGAQMLVALRKWSDARGVEVKLLFPSEVLLQSLSRLGYKRDLKPIDVCQ